MISPQAHVDPTAKIGNGVTVHPFAYIGPNVVIGDNCEIMPYASVVADTTIGTDCKIYQGAVVGASPQDFRWKPGQHSTCTIGNRTIIREQVIINRGFINDKGTQIGDGCFIMAETHIGHDSIITGRDVLGNGVKIAGEVVIGKCTILSSNVIVNEKSRIGKWVFIKGGTRISSNVPPYVIMAHNPVAYYGVNSPVMSRKNFSDADIDTAAKAYRHIYQTQTSVFNAIKRIETDIEPSKVRDNIIDFVRQNNYRIAAIPVDLTDD